MVKQRDIQYVINVDNAQRQEKMRDDYVTRSSIHGSHDLANKINTRLCPPTPFFSHYSTPFFYYCALSLFLAFFYFP